MSDFGDLAGGEAGAGADDADETDAVDDAFVDDMAGNRIEGALARGVLEYVAKSIVDDPAAVVVNMGQGRRGVDLRLHVAPDDMGKVIGRRGRVAQSLRAVVRAAGAREGVEATVDIVDE